MDIITEMATMPVNENEDSLVQSGIVYWLLTAWSFSKSPTDSGYEKEFLCKLSLAYGHLDPSFSLLLL